MRSILPLLTLENLDVDAASGIVIMLGVAFCDHPQVIVRVVFVHNSSAKERLHNVFDTNYTCRFTIFVNDNEQMMMSPEKCRQRVMKTLVLIDVIHSFVHQFTGGTSLLIIECEQPSDMKNTDDMIDVAINDRKPRVSCLMKIIENQWSEHSIFIDRLDDAARGHDLFDSLLIEVEAVDNHLFLFFSQHSMRLLDKIFQLFSRVQLGVFTITRRHRA